MSTKDLSQKKFFENNDIFAGIFNYRLYNGKQVIRQDDLIDQPTESFFHKDNEIHNQLRDVAKQWKKGDLILGFLGLELQSKREDDLILRILSYEGASYRRMYMEKQRFVPCFTIILYFGMDKPWPNDCISFHGYFRLDESTRQLLPDRKILVISMAFLDEEQRQLLPEDLRILAEFLYKIRVKEDYTKIKAVSKYMNEIFEVLKELSPDPESWSELERIYNERTKNMITNPVIPNILQDTLDRGIGEGIEIGREEGIEIGREEGLELGREEGRKLLEVQSQTHILNLIEQGMDNAFILKIVPESSSQQIDAIREKLNRIGSVN